MDKVDVIKILSDRRCIIGEGPIWNEKENTLYFTNGWGNEICTYSFINNELSIRKIPFSVPAFAFDSKNRLIVSHENGVYYLNSDNTLSPIYDQNIKIEYANDMKVGPDGAIYVGTQSGKRKGVSDKIDGKLYRIDPSGEVEVLLDNLILSNGMEWSIDEKKFYHTDSDTGIIKEYDFDKKTGKISFTGREIYIRGVDGFTIGQDNNLYVACWGRGHIAVIDTQTLQIKEYIDVPCKTTASCGFCGKDMDVLAITTASYHADVDNDKNAGFTILLKMQTKGRVPYIFAK
jgi:sugar lactone lactonase YvrE